MRNKKYVVRVPPRSEKMLGRFVVIYNENTGMSYTVRVYEMTNERVFYQVKEGPNAGKKFSAKYSPSEPAVYDRMCDAMDFSKVLGQGRKVA
jgi:hypothetical protein